MPSNYRRPNFFVIGAHKAGTTSLYEILKAHPQIFMSPVKEPGYFSIPEHAARGIEWYRSLFREAGDRPAVGEASTTYSLGQTYPGTARRVVEYAPDARVIYVVRHPLKRLESGWIQWRSEGRRISNSFSSALRDFPALIDSGRYWSQLQCYRELLPDERILVLFFEDFCRDPHQAAKRCFSFLGLDARVDSAEPFEARNPSAGKREDAWLLRLLRRLPAYGRVRDVLAPAMFRRRLKNWFTRPMAGRPEWTDASIDLVRHALGDEIDRFLLHCGQRPDRWSIPWRDTNAAPILKGPFDLRPSRVAR